MTGLNIDQVDSTSRTSAVRSLAGLSEGQLGNLSYAIGSMRTISDEGAAKLQESNTKHLDAALVAATPSKQPITDWALKEHEIRESLTRSKNAASNGARSSTHWGQHAQLCPPTRLVPATARLNRPLNRPSATPCPRASSGARQIKTSKTIQMVAVAEATLPSIRRCHEAVARGISKAN